MLLEAALDTEEDLLMMYIQAFQTIYKREYLEKVLGYHWREEGMHQMNLRHEAELNKLKKLHTQQKEDLLDEMRRRKNLVKQISQKMRDHKRYRREFNDGESMSQIMEFESNSIRSKEFHLKGSFLIADDILTENLSRINQPFNNHDGDFFQKEDNDPMGSQLLIDINNGKSQASKPPVTLEHKDSSEKKVPSNCGGDNHKSNIVIDSPKITLPQAPDQGNLNISNLSLNQHSGNYEAEWTPKPSLRPTIVRATIKGLQLNLTNVDNELDDEQDRLIKTQRTIESRIEESSLRKFPCKEDVKSLKNFSPMQKRQRYTLEELRDQLEVQLAYFRKE